MLFQILINLCCLLCFFCGYFLLLFQNSSKKSIWCPPFCFFPLPCEGDRNLRLCSGSYITAQPQHSLPTIKSGGGALECALLQAAQNEILEASPLGVTPRSTRIPSAPLSGTTLSQTSSTLGASLSSSQSFVSLLCYGLFVWPRACMSPHAVHPCSYVFFPDILFS